MREAGIADQVEKLLKNSRLEIMMAVTRVFEVEMERSGSFLAKMCICIPNPISYTI